MALADYGLVLQTPALQPVSPAAGAVQGMQTGADINYKNAQTANTQLQMNIQKMQTVNNLFGSVAFAPPEQQEALYNQNLKVAKAYNLDTSGLPPTWGPEAQTAVQSGYYNSGLALQRMKVQTEIMQAQALMGRNAAEANYFSVKSGGQPLFGGAGTESAGMQTTNPQTVGGNAQSSSGGYFAPGQPSQIAQVAQDTENAKEKAKAWQAQLAKSQGAATNYEYNKGIINQTDQAVDNYSLLPTGKLTGGLRQYTDQESAQLIDKNSAQIQQSMVKQLVQGGGLGKIMQAENTMIMKATPDNYKTTNVNHKIDTNLLVQNELLNNLQPKLLMQLNAMGPAYQDLNLAGNVMDEILTRAKIFDPKTGDADKAALNKLPSATKEVLSELKQGNLKFTYNEFPSSSYKPTDMFQGVDASGKPISGTYSQLQDAAKASNMSVDDYMKKLNLSPIQPQNNQQQTPTIQQQSITPQGQNVPRGIRNNNPGNIVKTSQTWNGEVQGNDPKFKTFASPQAGINGISTLLDKYAAQGKNTIADIVRTYAPPSENNTVAYIRDVAQKLGINPLQKLDLSNPMIKGALVKAIIEHENGHVPYNDNMILGSL